MFDIYTIIFLALAVFIFLRLRSVLGQRTGRERPPYDPYSARDVRPRRATRWWRCPAARPTPVQKSAEPVEPAERWKGIAEPGSALAAGLDAIAREDKSFDAKHFLAGARAAYEMIVTAYASGDRRQLKNLLGREVYDGFEAAIREREQRGETVETRFVSIDGADIIGAELRGKHRAGDGALRVAARLGDARPRRRRHRRQSGQGDRRHRRLDVRARHHVARSELETGRDRSRAMTSAGRRRSAIAERDGSAGAALIVLGRRRARRRPQCADSDVKIPNTQIEPVAWAEIDGWAEDDHAAAFATFLQELQGDPARHARRCARRARSTARCTTSAARRPTTSRTMPGEARAFFEQNFRPVRISPLGEPDGFLTGYYEPIVEGTRERERRVRRIRSIASRRICCPAAACCGRAAVVASPRARRQKQAAGRQARGWCRSTIAPRSTTACSPAAISKSAG